MPLSEDAIETEGVEPLDAPPLEPVVIEVTEGPDAGSSVQLSSGTLRVGTSAECELVLIDPTVSRVHARIELLAGSVRVVDLNSRNGTTYLGARLTDAVVPIGGTLRVGRTSLRVAATTGALDASPNVEFHGLYGQSLAMRRLFARLERVARTSSVVLLEGETGSGKDAVARAIHAASGRADKPWCVVDCTTLTSSLAESELFGHVKGAFTGADRARVGAVETAAGGTLFLDEIGDLPLELQPKLLRLLEAREYRRVGESAMQQADVRVIAATHRSLAALTEAGTFRRDLFRLAVVVMKVPPLRERREDIAELARRFAHSISGLDIELSPKILGMLEAHDWPGNVRELRNTVERVVNLGDHEIGLAEAKPHAREAGVGDFHSRRDELTAQFEREYLQALLKAHGSNLQEAAKVAGISRSFLYKLLEKHGL